MKSGNRGFGVCLLLLGGPCLGINEKALERVMQTRVGDAVVRGMAFCATVYMFGRDKSLYLLPCVDDMISSACVDCAKTGSNYAGCAASLALKAFEKDRRYSVLRHLLFNPWIDSIRHYRGILGSAAPAASYMI